MTVTSLTSRAIAPLRPLPAPADPIALDRLQANRRRSALGWLGGGVAVAQLAGFALPWGSASGAPLLPDVIALALIVLMGLGMLLAGCAQLALLVRAQPHRLGSALGIGALVAFGVLLAPVAGLLAILFGLAHLLAPVGAAALGIVLLSFDPSMRSGMPHPRLGTALGATAGLLAIAIGVLDALVLLPMTLMPGMPLTELYAGLVAANEAGGVWVPLAWAGLWVVGIALLALGLLRNRRDQREAAGTLLAAAFLALLAIPMTQFSIGMGVADAFGTGGGLSMAFPAIMLAGALAVTLATGLLIGAARR